MDAVTRRRFLIASGVTGAAGLAAGATWYPIQDILSSTAGGLPELEPLAPESNVVVLVTLYGGNDGLNTVIPYADPNYDKARPELSYKDNEVLKLDDATGLNPGLKGIHRMFGEKKVAIVRGVGYPDADRSHFRSMDIWHTADPKSPGTTGWVGRWLDTTETRDPRLALSFENVLPPLLAGARSAGAVVGANGLRLPRTYSVPIIKALGQAAEGEPMLQARAAGCFADLVGVDNLIKEAKETVEDLVAAGEIPKATGTGGGGSALDQQLNLVAQCVEAKVPTRVYSVSLGGFDTHADEKPAHQALLGILDRAVTGFMDRMGRTNQGKRVTVAVYSEFGRRVRANASDGTDHGTAADMFVVGHNVNGGLVGEAPSLTKLDRSGDLKYTTDFRDVYASLLGQGLLADPVQVLEGWKGQLAKLLK